MKAIFTPSRVADNGIRANGVMSKTILPQFLVVVFLVCFTGSTIAQVSITKSAKSILSEKNLKSDSGPWFTTGNAGTNPSVNFIGTTDAQRLVFKVNNQQAGYIDHSDFSENSAFGYQTLYSNVESDIGGLFLSAFGYRALFSNTTGFGNTGIGTRALLFNTTGTINTAIGGEALFTNKTGSFNTATGYNALYANESGDFNTATGDYALAGNTTGSFNIANGTPFTLAFNTEGSENTAIGPFAMGSNTTGNENVAYGTFALGANVTGNNNTALGYKADVAADNLTNATAIGNSTVVDASNKVRIGNDDVTSIGGKVGWTNYSDERIKEGIRENVPGLSFINALRPVTYHISIAKENALLGKKAKNMNALSMPVNNKGSEISGLKDMETQAFQKLTAKGGHPNPAKVNEESGKIQYTGFLAQEVEKAASGIGYEFSGVDKTGKIMGLRYSEFVVPLVKAVQELSKKNEELEKKNNLLEEKLNKLEALIIGRSNPVSPTSTYLLEQNQPNPFNYSTSIRYNIPYDFQKAQLILSDFNGRVFKKIDLKDASGLVYIDGSLLRSGGYTYTLITDNSIAETKKLIVAK